MVDHIGVMNSENGERITDKTVVFSALYNLLYDKIQEEPKKGLVICKGKPNQRKEKWTTIMEMAHDLEDFFVTRDTMCNKGQCCDCVHWKQHAGAQSHLGDCKGKLKHKFHSCKHFKGVDQ